jgi:hypothetical protein
MKTPISILLVILVFIPTETKGQRIMAGIVSPGNYYYDFIPDTSTCARPVHLGGLNNPSDTLDILFDSQGEFILRFCAWGDGGLGGGGGDANVFPLAGQCGFRAHRDSSFGWPGAYSYLYVPDTLDIGDTIQSGQKYLFQTPAYF